MEKDNTKFLKNLPPKGTADWFPSEYAVRKYIFDTFRKVCTSFGYEEYLTPTFEKAEIYKAKSGEDVGGKELMIFQDKAEREFALRPEMTPSVIRMVTRIYNSQPKPMRLFSITNFFRNEKPQKGRNREFWQLNYDLFGSKSINADVEIVKIAIEIMCSFLPQDRIKDKDYKPFKVYINDRRILTEFLEIELEISKNNITQVVRILDKKDKMEEKEFEKALKAIGLDTKQVEKIKSFLKGELQLKNMKTKTELNKLIDILNKQGYEKWIEYKPSLVRGFDYYNGIVYEIYDTNPKNNRSLFGGGRYDGLGKLFGNFDIPAVGVAPGDETLKLFLEGWDLLGDIEQDKKTRYYIPTIDSECEEERITISKKLRKEGNIITEGLEKQSLQKALEYANKKNFEKMIILGSNELRKKQYIEKDMKSGKQTVVFL